MLYPVYVHIGDERHAHGVIFPDFPGCFSAADRWEDLPAAIQEAVECHFGPEGDTVPPPSELQALVTHPDYQAGGVWMLVDIDLSRIGSRAIRLNVSLPESLVRRIDETAKARHMTRSGFLAEAARRAIENGDGFISHTRRRVGK